MTFEEMNVEEIIAYFSAKESSYEAITLDELEQAVEACDVKDSIADNDAITLFYSGGEDSIINAIAAENNDNIRLIRRTERFELLDNEVFCNWVKDALEEEYPELSKMELEQFYNDYMYGVSEADTGVSDVGQGLWVKCSADFARATTGDVYALISDSQPDRIFARDELKQVLYSLGDDITICGYKKSDLAGKKTSEVYLLVKQAMRDDIANSNVYITNKGYKVGRSFEGSMLEGVVQDVIPSDMTNITVMTSSAYTNAYEDSTVFLDNDGNIIGRSYKNTALEGVISDSIPAEYESSTSFVEYSGRVYGGESNQISIAPLIITGLWLVIFIAGLFARRRKKKTSR